MIEEELITGRIIRSHGNEYHVATPQGQYVCKLRGKFRLADENIANPVAVGDEVRFSLWREEGMIEEILPRRSKLSRLLPGKRLTEIEHILVANVDQVILITATRQPAFKIGMVDRFLLAAERQRLPALICINKIDMRDTSEFAPIAEMYSTLGYPTFLTSAKTQAGIDDFAAMLKGKVSVFTGHSGVGKTSILNTVETGLGLRIGRVSEKTNKGRHTTTHSELFPLSGGGFVADTPGFREFGLLAIEAADLPGLFPEFSHYLGECQFHNCRHLAEPGCAIKAGLEKGKIYSSRYESYCKIQEEMMSKPKY